MCYASAMPRFEPFAGVRYSASVPLADVISPPYDVIDRQERAVLTSRNPHNSVLIDLPSTGDPDKLRDPHDPYEHAAELLTRWLAENILSRDDEPSLYAYQMTFQDEQAQTHTTLGVLGALGLPLAGETDILPHEQTHPKAKSDRLKLLRACQANLSPIWGLSLSSGLSETLRTAREAIGSPTQSAIADDGVRHDLWRIVEPVAMKDICSSIAENPVIIADGHHRYETALTYALERRSSSDAAQGGHDLVMTLIVELAPNQLRVQPIHRVITGLPSELDLPAALAKHLDLREAPELGRAITSDAATNTRDPSRLLEDAHAMGLITASGTWFVSTQERSEHMREAREALSAGQGSRETCTDDPLADLDSAILAAVLNKLPQCDVSYVSSWVNAAEAVSNGSAQAAVLLRPATVDQIAATAHSNRRMPPKTTYFHPKPRTGMVFRLVDDPQSSSRHSEP